MKSHFYLLHTSIKNRFKELLRKPAKLALYLLVILGVVGMIALSLVGAGYNEGALPLSYLQGIFFVFLIIFYVLAVQKGLAAGDAIFEMNDVNLLFVSPVNPRSTLLYGIIKLAGMSFWAGFFLLFQSGTLANFGVGFDGVLILFGAFILNMMALTLLSLVIYSASNGNPGRKRIVRILAVAVFIPLLAFFAARYLENGDIMQALNDVLASPLFASAPFVGWSSAGAIALMQGNLPAGLGWIGLVILAGAGMLLYIMLSRSDYYEDVLVATETAFEKKRAAAEGDVQAAGAANARVKVKKTGLYGKGVHVFFYKHLRETFRQNRLGFFSMYIIFMAAGMIAMAFFLRGMTDVIMLLQVIMWVQVFMIGTGRGLLETYSHYIYLIPGSPFKKLLWSNMELMLRTAVESVLFLMIPGIILGSNPLIILGSMAVFILFSLMLLGVNYLSMRFTEANISQGVLLIIYFFAVVLLLAPGLVAALIVGFTIGGTGGTMLALLILSGWELLVSLACFALSRNVLHSCDMPTMKKK